MRDGDNKDVTQFIGHCSDPAILPRGQSSEVERLKQQKAELLAACKDMVAALMNPDPDASGDHVYSAMINMNAVIARAEKI